MFTWVRKSDFLLICFAFVLQSFQCVTLISMLRKRKGQPQREIEEVLDQMGRTLNEATQIDIPRKCKIQAQSENEEALNQVIEMGQTMDEATQIDIPEVNDQVIQKEPVAPREPEGAYESCFATLFCPIHHEQDLTFKRNKNLKDIFIVLPTTVICLASKIIF